MNPQVLLNKPKIERTLTPKITVVSNLSNLVESSREITKTSKKLKKVFEKGTYQKKTHLTVLNRYKRRLDSIQKQNDKKFSEKKKVKIKPPEIKKYTGSLFSNGGIGDPLKMMAALAGLNAFSKLRQGKWIDAIGPALVFGGLTVGPSLAKGAFNLLRKSKVQPQTSVPTSTSGGGLFKGTPYAETKAGKAYAGMQAQRNLPKWAQRAAGGSASRFAASNERMFQGTANIGDRARLLSRKFGFGGIGGVAENIAARGGGVAAEAAASRAGGSIAAKAAGVSGRAIPLLGTALNIGLSAYRFSQGDVVGGILSAVSAIPIIGWAALGVDLAREFGAFDGTFLGRKGKEKLKKQTEEQKKIVKDQQDKKAQGEGGILTFRKTLNSYERVVNKFEEFAKNFKGSMEMSSDQVKETASKIEDLGAGSSPISGAGYEFTNDPSFAQYLTGDINAPREAYDASHGTVDNYHDHFAFKDPDTARRAAAFLQSKGIEVTELQGVGGGVTGPHSGAGSAHHRGLAFDVPGAQWKGSGPIGPREYAGSAKVRAFMNDFYKMENKRKPAAKPKPPQSSTPEARPAATPTPTPQPTPTKSSSPLLNAISDPVIEESIVVPFEKSAVVPTAPMRSIEKYPSYDSRSQVGQLITLPIPIPQQQPQTIQQQSSAPPMIMGPSEEQLLNSFYKNVFLTALR